MHNSPTNVLFVSQENAVRSLLAEACLRHLGREKFRAFSCGVPELVANGPRKWTTFALEAADIPSAQLRSKPWSEFTKSSAPRMDFVISLDAEAHYDSPKWPGQPETALWDYPALAGRKVKDPQLGVASVQTLVSLRRRIELLIILHGKVLAHTDLRHDLRDMAHL